MLRREVAFGGEADKALATFLNVTPFWLVMNRAVHDRGATIGGLHLALNAAAALVLSEDLRAPEETAMRVAAQLEEDISDNTWLKEWK